METSAASWRTLSTLTSSARAAVKLSFRLFADLAHGGNLGFQFIGSGRIVIDGLAQRGIGRLTWRFRTVCPTGVSSTTAGATRAAWAATATTKAASATHGFALCGLHFFNQRLNNAPTLRRTLSVRP